MLNTRLPNIYFQY